MKQCKLYKNQSSLLMLWSALGVNGVLGLGNFTFLWLGTVR